MPANFSVPVTSDLRAAVLQSIRDMQIALAKMLDGETLTGTPTNAIRYNSGASQFERWNGAAWGALPLNFLPVSGGTLTGALTGTSASFTSLTLGGPVNVSYATPDLALNATDAPVDNRRFRLRVNSAGRVQFGFTNDALSTAVNWMSVSRSGNVPAISMGPESESADLWSSAARVVALKRNASAYMAIESPDTLRSAIMGQDSSGAIFGAYSNHPVEIRQNNTARITIATDGRATFTQPLMVETSGSVATLRNIEFKSAGQPNVAFGSFAGAWRPSLTIQGQDATHYMFMVGPDSATAIDARIWSTRGIVLRGGASYNNNWSGNGMQFHTSDGATLRGYVYHDSTGFGLLGNAGGWAVRIPPGTNRVESPADDIRSDAFSGRSDPSKALQINASSFTYGGWYLNGSRNGYHGLVVNDATHNPTFMSDGTSIGIYCQSGPRGWLLIDDGTNFAIVRPLFDAATGYRYPRFTSGGSAAGGAITVSTSAPSGTPANGDMWIQRAA